MNAYFGVTDKKNIRFSIYPMTLIEIDNCDKMEFEEIITPCVRIGSIQICGDIS